MGSVCTRSRTFKTEPSRLPNPTETARRAKSSQAYSTTRDARKPKLTTALLATGDTRRTLTRYDSLTASRYANPAKTSETPTPPLALWKFPRVQRFPLVPRVLGTHDRNPTRERSRGTHPRKPLETPESPQGVRLTAAYRTARRMTRNRHGHGRFRP